jgi:hypothetical protein
MNWKDYVKKIVESRPDIKPKHGIEMSRRELFAQGYIATGSYIAMPGILSLVSQRANAGEDLCRTVKAANANKTSVLIIDGAGGWQIAGRNIIVGGEGGQTDFLGAANYASIGLMPTAADFIKQEDIPANTSTPAGKTVAANEFGLLMHPRSYLYDGMMAATTAGTRSNIDGRIICVRSGDDSETNPHNPCYWLRAAGAEGSVVSILGTEDSPFGGRGSGPESSIASAYKPVRVNSANDAVGLVLPGLLATVGGDKFVAAVMNATKKMSDSQIKKFNSLSVNEQFQIACAYSNANYQASSFDAAEVDPRLDADITAVYGNQNGGRDAALVKMLLDGYAGVATLRVGGCDYHGTDVTNWSAKDREIGTIIGRAMEAAALKGKNLHIIAFTDGSTSCSGNGSNDAARGFFGPTNDSGSRSSVISFTYSTAGRPEIRDGKRQAGHFNETGAVQGTHAFSDAPAVAAELLLADYLALHEPDLNKVAEGVNKIAGKNTLGANLANFVGYKKLA